MQEDLRDSQEQAVLRGTFYATGKAGPSTPCPCCCPGSTRKRVMGWERGKCGDLIAMRCNNCGYIRTSKPRSVQRHNGLTLGQERGVSRVVWALERFIHNSDKFTIAHEAAAPYSSGDVYVTFTWKLKDSSNSWLNILENGWCSFVVGVNGALELVSYNKGTSDRKHQDTMAGHLATLAQAKLKLI